MSPDPRPASPGTTVPSRNQSPPVELFWTSQRPAVRVYSAVRGRSTRARPGRVPGMDKPFVDPIEGPAPTDLRIIDLEEGSGPEATPGHTVAVHYVGVAHSTGEEFDSSYGRGEPLVFPLGAGRVISGWDNGLVGMKVGGRPRRIWPTAAAVRVGRSPRTRRSSSSATWWASARSCAARSGRGTAPDRARRGRDMLVRQAPRATSSRRRHLRRRLRRSRRLLRRPSRCCRTRCHCWTAG